MEVLTKEQIRKVAQSMKRREMGFDFYNYMISEITKGINMNKEERDAFTYGFINGFVASVEVSNYLINDIKSTKN